MINVYQLTEEERVKQFYSKYTLEEAQKINSLDQNSIIAKARAYNIKLGGTLQSIRSELIVAVARQRIKEEQERMKRLAMKMQKTKVMTK